ncbi:putative hydrolase [Lachnellula suecica]|uniref:Putative hydrolase n=1 Tax=Lachnellula suecica TaxID=602035 RepID=A0A8T9CGU5_9HELO|nr:putative hydrolase [Lachnellula suecica]
MPFNPTYATVENEDCNLHYWYQGTGPLILFIPGGNGHGRQYNGMISMFSDIYTCATFDRRQMSASKVKVNKPLSHTQQARDVKAVIEAVGFDKAIVFGSSLGGIIAFQFAIDFPDMIDHIISHEAPTHNLLPEASDLYDFFLGVIELSKTSIPEAAAEFDKIFVGFGQDGVPDVASPEPENPINFWENEVLPASLYTPDLRRLVEHGTSVGLMAGKRSRDATFARTTIEQENILGCLRMIVPGHHQGFEAETEAFGPAFTEMIEILNSRRSAAATALK